MVKVGFICEGESEKILCESEAFQDFLKRNNLQCVFPIIDAMGNGNLLPKNINAFYNILTKSEPTCVFILTDLDQDKCISRTKERIFEDNEFKHQTFIIVAIKQLEAWFLADTEVITKLLKTQYFVDFPESYNVPLEFISQLSQQYIKRGLGSVKPLIVKKMLKLGFSIENAAKHPNCHSAKYFIDKLKEVANNQTKQR